MKVLLVLTVFVIATQGGPLDAFGSAAGKIKELWGGVPQMWKEGVEREQRFLEKAKSQGKGFLEKLKAGLETATGLTGKRDELAKKVQEAIDETVEGGADRRKRAGLADFSGKIKELWGGIPQMWQEGVEREQQFLEKAKSQGAGFLQRLKDGLATATGLMGKRDELATKVQEAIDESLAEGGDRKKRFIFRRLREKYGKKGDEEEKVEEPEPEVAEPEPEVAEPETEEAAERRKRAGLADISGKIRELWGGIPQMWQEGVEREQKFLEKAKSQGAGFLQKLKTGLETATGLMGKRDELAKKVQEAIDEQIAGGEGAARKKRGILDRLSGAQDQVKSFLGGFGDSWDSWIEKEQGIIDQAKTQGKGFLENLKQGLEVLEGAKAKRDELVGAVNKAIQETIE